MGWGLHIGTKHVLSLFQLENQVRCWCRLVVLDVSLWLSVVGDLWLSVISDSWLRDDGLLDWDDGLGNDSGLSDSFLVDDSVESVDGVSSVVDDTAGSISFDQRVLSLNDISVA